MLTCILTHLLKLALLCLYVCVSVFAAQNLKGSLWLIFVCAFGGGGRRLFTRLTCSLHLATSSVAPGTRASNQLQPSFKPCLSCAETGGAHSVSRLFALWGSCSRCVLQGEAAGYPCGKSSCFWCGLWCSWLSLSAFASLKWGSVFLVHLGLGGCCGQVLCPLASPSFFNIALGWGFSSGCGLAARSA